MTSRFRMWPLALFAATLVVSAMPSGAVAAAPDEAVEAAKQHFNRGVASYRDGDYDAALAEFEKAYETRPDYRVLYNLGQVQAERHDNAAAMKMLKQYLKEGGAEIDNERRLKVEQTLDEVSKRVGSVVVTSNVAGADVLVDGASAGVLPLAEPLAVNAGIREITIRKDGKTAPARRITVVGGDTVRIEVRLESDGALAPNLSAPLPSASPPRTRVWIAYGAAAALAAGAVTFGLLTQRANKDLDGDLGRFPGDRSRIDVDRSRVKKWAAFTDGFAAAALVGAGLGTYFLLADPASGESAAPPASVAQVSLLPSGAALSLSGSF